MINGKLNVTWTKDDYESLQFQQHPNPYRGFVSDVESSSELKIALDVCYDIPKNISECLKQFDLKNMSCQIQRYAPGNYLPWHRDTYNTYRKYNAVTDTDNIVRIIVALHDSTPGQQLWIDEVFCHEHAGEYFGWKNDCLHMAANLSESFRYNLQITGTEAISVNG